MLITALRRGLSQFHEFFHPDAGAGAAGQTGASSNDRGSGTGGGAPGAGAGAATGSGSGTPAAYRLTDDALVDFGDGQPVAWRDVVGENGRYMSRDRFDRGAKLLEGIATQLEAKERELTKRGAGRRDPDEPRQPVDRYADVRGLAVVDGQTVAQLAERLEKEGFAPLAQVVQQLAAKLTAQEKQLAGLQGATGHLAGKDNEQQFEGHITAAIDAVGKLGTVKGLPEGVTIDANDPFMREVAKDVWLSHDQQSWRKGEFEKSLRDRLESAVAFVRALDKKAVAAAEEKRRNWYNPRKGNGRPSGEAAYVHKSGSQMAEELFAQMGGART